MTPHDGVKPLNQDVSVSAGTVLMFRLLRFTTRSRLCTHTHIYICIYRYIYIHTEREREGSYRFITCAVRSAFVVTFSYMHIKNSSPGNNNDNNSSNMCNNGKKLDVTTTSTSRSLYLISSFGSETKLTVSRRKGGLGQSVIAMLDTIMTGAQPCLLL